MPSTRPRPLARTLLLAALLGAGSAFAPLHAQSTGPDLEPPLIELEAVTESVADRTQVFTVQAVDDRNLDSVTLHHRREGRQPFTRTEMRPLDAAGYYSVSITTDPADLRAIEYYVQAIDEGGNRTVEGYAFEPLRRTLRPPPTPIASSGRTTEPAPEPAAESGLTPRRRWWAVALGVVAVGALASLAAGGGGDDGGGGTVPLTIDVQEPAIR